ncbi:unnamed protein product [Cladocopium goreaui]|uniref:BTB domain-containing protein n=1 Tax=Cladocopium goreaui TaxID=2562237 RepID=A0A9P1GPM1_9DINO|nr:unnamed protein product [Cladocopium goreaui]
MFAVPSAGTGIDSISKPKLLPDTVFGWTEGYTAGSAGTPKLSVEEVRKRANAKGLHTGQGFELFFDQACRVSPEADFKIPERLRLDTLREPRSECERVVLSNAFLTMFPNFANAILFTFWRMTFKLARLSMDPTKAMVDEILKVLYDFLRRVQQGGKNFYLDDDFYKAFGYRKDGSLFGKLWSNLPSALTEIAATLQTRKDTRTQWITESIAFRSKLKSARRMRVRELENDRKTIATEVEGCICQEQWTAYKWRKLMPQLETFSGCVENSDQQSLKFVKNSSSWKGFCKTKRDMYSAVTTQCGVKFAECDPEAESKKPKFQIWRSADVLRAVRLPLLQLDLYLHIDLRNRRADFCTPNFAPLMLDSNTHWSMSNWLPYDLRRSGCFGARIHPPGFSLQLTRCRHRALGSSKKVTTEWSMTGVAYLVSHYNVWGTGDGDMTRTWFGGGENWGAAAASQGWPNFLMADPGTWFSSSAGSGYLSTPSVAASPSAFWFGLLAEVISTLSMAEFFSPKNASSKMHTAKTAVTTAVVVIWRLLQKYAVVPNSWSAFMGTASVLKSLGMKGLLKATGFRNEHDVVLSLKYATNFARRRLDLASLINDMSMDQLREIFFAAKVLGAPVDQLWVNHTSTAAGAPSVVRNMHRERCDGRPLWYKAGEEYGTWTRWTSSILIALDPSRSNACLGDFEIEQVLQQVSVETLECWGNHISSVESVPKAKPEMFKRIMMEANRKEKKMTPSIFDSSGQLLKGTEVPLGYFSLSYVRTFMSENFGNFLSSMNTSKQESFLKIFGRGKKSRVKLKQSPIVSLMRSILRPGRRDAIFAKEAPSGFQPEEISSSKTSYYDVGLSILTRLGFSFIKLPGIFQLQPYLQLSVQYDVKEILRVFKAKVRPGHESSKVQEHLRRKRTCEQCIEMNLAFCDRQEAADAMLKKGHTMDMDACEPMDLQSKEMCHRFALPEGTHLAKTLRGDGLFKKEVCPCYRPVSGTQIVPRWITTKASCADISWPDAEVEALKRASKDRDWSSGFSMQNQNVRFGLDEMDKFNSEPPKQKGCLEGYRCCAILQDSEKPSKVRCVETKSLFKKSSWIHPTSKCKYFKPKDLKGPWTHAEQHCAADDVDGYWSWNKEANEWHEESAPVEVPTEAEALTGSGALDPYGENVTLFLTARQWEVPRLAALCERQIKIRLSIDSVLPLLRVSAAEPRAESIQDACKQFFLANYQACTNLQECEALDPRLLCELMRLNTAKAASPVAAAPGPPMAPSAASPSSPQVIHSSGSAPQLATSPGARSKAGQSPQAWCEDLQESSWHATSLDHAQALPASTLAQDLKRLLTEEIAPDFEVVVQDEVILVHKFLMVARSKYFETCILTSGMQESQEGRLVIDASWAMTAEEFRALLHFLYAGDEILRILAPHTAMYLVDASSFYGLTNHRLKHFCELCIKDSFNETHVLQLFEASSRLDVEGTQAVRSMALDFIISNFHTVCQQPALEQLDRSLLIEIMRGVADRLHPSPPQVQVSSLPNVALGGEASSFYTGPSVQTYASPAGVYGGAPIAGGAYSGGTLTAGAYTGGTLAAGSYTGGTSALSGAYTGGTSALAGAYTPGTLAGGTYSPSSGAYTGAVVGGTSYTGGTVAGAAYTPGTISSGLAYTPGSISGGVTTVSGGNYSSAPAYGTGTGSFSIAPANTYGGYYGAGTYSSPPAEAQGASSASFTVPPMGQDPYSGTAALPTTNSMLLNPLNPLQSAPSMIAYNSGLSGGFGTGLGYSSAMDGPFKFYATPPGKLPEEPRPSKTDDAAQTGFSLRAGVSSEPREDAESSSKKSGKKHASKKKKSSGCC